LYLTYHKLNERHDDFLIKLPKKIEYIFMHLCYDFVSPKLSCLDPNIIKSAEIQSQAIEFAQRNLLLVQGNLL
jgi:hypothetical protein